jgi:hypothetical protein
MNGAPEWFQQEAAKRGITLISDEDFFVQLLDHIDILTARAEKAEAERDALRVRLEDCIVALAETGAGSIVIDDPDEGGQ